MDESFKIRMTTASDIEALSNHHVRMFREIYEKKGKFYPEEIYEKVFRTHKNKLLEEMPKELCYGWVVENSCGEIVSSGETSLSSFDPSPEGPDSTICAYIHSIYTDKKYRGKKLSTMVMNEIINFCKSKGIRRLILRASDAGRLIYEAIGFERGNFMIMIIS